MGLNLILHLYTYKRLWSSSKDQSNQKFTVNGSVSKTYHFILFFYIFFRLIGSFFNIFKKQARKQMTKLGAKKFGEVLMDDWSQVQGG